MNPLGTESVKGIQSPNLPAGRVAVLFLNADGKVIAANQEAKLLWQVADGELIGDSFPSLFALDIVCDEPEMAQAQCDVLLAAVLDKGAELKIEPREGAPRLMFVRAERALGDGGYVVTVQPTIPLAPAAAASDDSLHGMRLFAEHGAVGFFDLNLKSGAVVYSPAWKRMLGYTDAELANTYEVWLGLIHPEDSGAAPDKVGRKSRVGARPLNVEFRMKHRLGQWVWIHCVGVQVVSASGELERVVGVHIDATERKEVEESGLASESRMSALAQEGKLAVFDLDFAGGTHWFSEAWERIIGRTPAADPATALAEILGPEECPGGFESWVLAQEADDGFISRAMRLRTVANPALPALVGIKRTLTRKRTLSSVIGFIAPLDNVGLEATPTPSTAPFPAASSPLFDEVLAAVSEGVLGTDAEGRVTLVNAVAARILGKPREALIGQQLEQVFVLVDRQSGTAGDSVADRALSATGNLPLISDQAVVVEGAAPVPLVWTARVKNTPDGKPAGLVVVFRNPEEMSLTPEELIKANRFESLGLLAGGIAHDFNNLLTTILGGVSMAKDNRDLSKLADSEKACMTAKGLTKQLLLFAKGGKSAMSTCAPKEILDDAVKIASAGATTEITVEVAEATAAVTVDRGQILQVFQNLIVNSIQAMPPAPHRGRIQLKAGPVRLAAGQIGKLAEGAYVEFEVRDNGSGIKPEHLEHIWDPFFTTKKHGAGLGLATVLSIVRKHGGEIGLQSVLGEGTVFSLYFPVAEAAVEVQARPAPSLRFGTGRVLFMDDDPEICSLTGSMLESLDYKFDIARNGDEAITLYKRYLNIGRPYDAVIMDLTVIGGMGGEEAFRSIKELDADVRAIVSSGYDSDDMAKQYLEMGFCGYLTKPYRVTDLGKVLKAVLG